MRQQTGGFWVRFDGPGVGHCDRYATADIRGPFWCSFSLAFSVDGKLVASASDDKIIRLWDLATGVMLGVLKVDGLITEL